MKITSLDDIENNKRKEEYNEIKQELAGGISDVIDIVRKKRQQREKKSILGKLLGIVLVILLILFLINFLLGNIWLIKFFIKDLFL